MQNKMEAQMHSKVQPKEGVDLIRKMKELFAMKL